MELLMSFVRGVLSGYAFIFLFIMLMISSLFHYNCEYKEYTCIGKDESGTYYRLQTTNGVIVEGTVPSFNILYPIFRKDAIEINTSLTKSIGEKVRLKVFDPWFIPLTIVGHVNTRTSCKGNGNVGRTSSNIQ